MNKDFNLASDENLANFIGKCLYDIDIPNNSRARVSASLLYVALEHHEAIIRLHKLKLSHAAFALSRPLFESFARGVWISICATEQQVGAFIKRDELPKINRTVQEIERNPTFESGTIGRAFRTNFDYLCGLTHSGMAQIQFIMFEPTMASNIPRDAVFAAVGHAGALAALSAMMILNLAIGATPKESSTKLLEHLKQWQLSRSAH